MQGRRGGFTLVEVLAALAVLAIGLTTVISLLVSSIRMSGNTADRNVAKSIITEAVTDIEKFHLITNDMVTGGLFPGPRPEHIGLFIETVTATDSGNPDGIPTTHNTLYKNATVNGKTFDFHLSSYCTGMKAFKPPQDPNTARTFMWPFTNEPKFLGGPVNSGVGDAGSFGYRVIYRLERHPEWHPRQPDFSDYSIGGENLDSPFAGTYVLTLAVYRDVDRKGGRLEQLTDPVIVYLRDRRDRKLP